MSGMRLGVLGGTFDPVHFGHLRLAEEVLSQFHLDRVLFVPSGTPPHKRDGPVADAQDRWLMTVLATVSHPGFRVSTIEIERTGLSYSVETLAQIHHLYGPGAEFYFVLGADAVLEMRTWREPERVLELCHPVIAPRPGVELGCLADIGVPGLEERARFLKGLATDLSSTEIRKRVRAGESIRFMTPDQVDQYIQRYTIYAGPAAE